MTAPVVTTERAMEILDGIPGAFERAQEGMAHAARGECVPLDELADEGPSPRRQGMAGVCVTGRSMRDEHGRLLPGSVPGWGMSWWWHEQCLDPTDTAALSDEQMMRTVLRYWDAVNVGWCPGVPRERWVGPHDPCEPSG